MNQFEMPSVEQPVAQHEKLAGDPGLIAATEHFLGKEASYLTRETTEQAIKEASEEKQKISKRLETPGSNSRSIYFDETQNKYFARSTELTLGQIIASRHLGIDINLPEKKKNGGEKTLHKKYVEYATNDALFEKLDKKLADVLAVENTKKNTKREELYLEAAKPRESRNQQLGFFAEKIMIGFAETIAIDNPELGLSVIPGNVKLDIEQKIDFILETHSAKKGVGIETADLPEDHKTIGIQFTTNAKKAEFKAEQIASVKEKGIAVDDILYVAIDQSVLSEALKTWRDEGTSITGPWKFLPKETKEKTLNELFGSMLSNTELANLMQRFV